MVTRSVNLRMSNSLKRGSECSSGFNKVIVRIALFWRAIKCFIVFSFIYFITFCLITRNLHLIIKVKIIYMAKKPKRNQYAYTRLDFFPKQKGLKKHIYTARRSIRCDTKSWIEEEIIKEKKQNSC